MTLQDNARFTVFRLFEDYKENIDSVYLWDLCAIIKNAWIINAISECEMMYFFDDLRVDFSEV